MLSHQPSVINMIKGRSWLTSCNSVTCRIPCPLGIAWRSSLVSCVSCHHLSTPACTTCVTPHSHLLGEDCGLSKPASLFPETASALCPLNNAHDYPVPSFWVTIPPMFFCYVNALSHATPACTTCVPPDPWIRSRVLCSALSLGWPFHVLYKPWVPVFHEFPAWHIYLSLVTLPGCWHSAHFSAFLVSRVSLFFFSLLMPLSATL